MPHPPISQQITFIYTNDFKLSSQFYEQTMGFSLWLDQGTCRIYQVSGSGLLGVCQVSEASKASFSVGEQTNIILTIVTHQVDEWYSYLKAQGVKIPEPPKSNPNYHIYHFFLRDPNGYLIEIQRFGT